MDWVCRMDNILDPDRSVQEEPLDELPVCVNCGCSIKDGVRRAWQEISAGRQICAHLYVSACVSELRKRVEVLEGRTESGLDTRD